VEKVKVFWKPGAISQLKEQAEWYAANMGISAADKFWNGMIGAGDLLSANPYLGKIEPILKGFTKPYRSLVHHKDYKIIYFVGNDEIVHIVSVWHCNKGKSSL